MGDNIKLIIPCSRCGRAITGDVISFFLTRFNRQPRVCGDCIAEGFNQLSIECTGEPLFDFWDSNGTNYNPPQVKQ